MGTTTKGSGEPFVIPTVDISDYFKDPTSSKSKEIVSQIRQACITSGFFQITGHGISRGIQDTVLKCAKTLFDLPLEEKTKLQSAQGRGYELIGSQTLEPGMKADMKEVHTSIHSYLQTLTTPFRDTLSVQKSLSIQMGIETLHFQISGHQLHLSTHQYSRSLS